MIPWFQVTDVGVLGMSVPVFALTLALAVAMGLIRVRALAKVQGLDRRFALEAGMGAVFSGLIGAHVVSLVAYHPERLQADTVARLLDIPNGLSSTGGFLGALAGTWALCRLARRPCLPMLDVLALALPWAFVIGRLGCFLVHDHPGIRSGSFLAVRWPDGPRLDLGLTEALMWLLIAAGLHAGRRLWSRDGWPVGFLLLAYGTTRLALDALRASPESGGGGGPTGDARYGSLTPAQVAAMLSLLVGTRLLLGSQPAPSGRQAQGDSGFPGASRPHGGAKS